MPDQKALEVTIRGILLEELDLGLDPDELHATADLKDEVGLDSAALLELVTAIEEAFGIEVQAEEVTEENFRTIAGLACFVGRHTGRSPAC